MKDHIMIVDFSNMAWRANMSWGKDKEDEKSERVMVYNFFRNLRPLVEMFLPSKIFMVLEGYPKHRYEIFADYKANRIVKTASKQEVHDNYHANKKEILRLLKHFPITTCRAANYEADDVIASLCENLRDENIVIISNDTDYIQLLQKGYSSLKIYNPMRKKFQEAPTYHYLAWKCLRGDPSDNIPGFMSDAKAEKMVRTPSLLHKWMELDENRANFSINRNLIEFANVAMEEIEMQEGEKNFPLLRSELSQMGFDSFKKDSTWQKFCQTFTCVKF